MQNLSESNLQAYNPNKSINFGVQFSVDAHSYTTIL